MSDGVWYWVILATAGLIFVSVMGWGMWRDWRDEKLGKKD